MNCVCRGVFDLLSSTFFFNLFTFFSRLQNLGLVLELVNQVINALHDLAALSLGRLGDLQGLEARLDIDTEIRNSVLGQGLLLGLHDVGERRVSGGIETSTTEKERRERC